MGSGLLQGLIALTNISNTVLPPALRPEPLLMPLAQRHVGTPCLRDRIVQWIVQPLRFRRVLVGPVVAGLKATKRGLLCGRTSGIGDSAAGELLSGSTSMSV